MAAPEFIGVSANGFTVTEETAPWPLHDAGDFGLLVIESSGGDAARVAPIGWTSVPGLPLTDVADATGSRLEIYYKFAESAAEPGVLLTDTGDHQVFRLMVFRGVDAATPFAGTPATSTKTTASNTAVLPAVTTTSDDSLVVLVASRPNDVGGTTAFSGWANAALTALTERAECGGSVGDGGGWGAATGVMSAAGSTGTTSVNLVASTTNVLATIPLKAAGAFVAQGLAAAPSMLGAPALLAASVRAAWAGAPTMLGAPAALGTVGNSYLGWAAAPSPLGAPAATAQTVLAGWLALPGPLGAAAVLATAEGTVEVTLAKPITGTGYAPVTIFQDDFSSGTVHNRPFGGDLALTWTADGGESTTKSISGGMLLSPPGSGYLYCESLQQLPPKWTAEFSLVEHPGEEAQPGVFYFSVFFEAADLSFFGVELQVFEATGSTILYAYGSGAGGSAGYWEDRFEDVVPIVSSVGKVATYSLESAPNGAVFRVNGVMAASASYLGESQIVGDNYSSLAFYSNLIGLDGMSMAYVGDPITKFGAPTGYAVSASYEAAGWQATNFDTPYGANAYLAATIGELTRFGTPTTPTYTEHQAQGFNPTRFGTPYGLLPFEFAPVNQVASATGWLAAQFGTSAATANFAGQAQGWQVTQLGTPRYTAVLTAESLGMLTELGTSTVGSGHRAQGSRAAQFGVPTCAAGYLTQSFSRTRFGAPRASLPGALVTRGWCSTRFGAPRGSLPPPSRTADGFGATQFGVPAATIRHRAAALGPLSRFGRPTLRRNPTC